MKTLYEVYEQSFFPSSDISFLPISLSQSVSQLPNSKFHTVLCVDKIIYPPLSSIIFLNEKIMLHTVAISHAVTKCLITFLFPY